MKTMASVKLADARDAALVGRKASNLGELIRTGFDVPAGVVLPATIEDADVPAAAAEALAHLRGDRFAVRSSAIAEDLAEASFAGQYHTLLNVPREGVGEAVRACRDSASAQRVVAYREAKEIAGSPSGVAVIVQEMVDAEVAGVALSADPITGARDRIVVSAVKGLGESLVSGQATGDEWSIESGKATWHAASERAIDGDTALRVAAVAKSVAKHFGVPQDVEWAVDREGHLFLLQARPMTALPEEVRWESPDDGSYVRNYRLGEWFFEPLTPLFADWAVKRLEARVWEVTHQLYGFPLPDRSHVLVNGWYFQGLDWLPRSRLRLAGTLLRCLLQTGAWRSRRRMALMMPPNVEFAVRAHHEEFRRRVQPVHRQLVEKCSQLASAAAPEELVELVDRLADDAGEYFWYIGVVGGYAWKSELKLAQFCRRYLAGSDLASHQELLLACREPEAASHAVVSLDWYRPLSIENGASDVGDERRARHERLLVRRQAAESAAHAALAPQPKLLRRFEALLSVAMEFAAIREEQVSELTLAWPVFRLALRRLGEELVRRKVVAAADEIYFLTREEVIAASGDLTGTARARRETWKGQRHLAPPLKLGPEHPLWAQLMDDHVDSFRASTGTRGEELVRGMPSSPGVARGRVRVVTGPEGFNTFRAGEVLVAQTTTPGWTPLFARAAAVVTDVGSVMAHASLVAREYGIPAVVGSGDATRKLRDGMLVTVDGSAGVVLEAN
jgi:rifampicin phosphotransferase